MVPYSIKVNPAIGSCVYKLFYNSKYVIVKAKNMQQSADQLQVKLNQVVRNTTVLKKEDLYYHLIEYILQNPGQEFTHELLIEDDRPYYLLQAEQKALDLHRKDPSCLNNNTDAYIPAFNEETRMYGWIPQTSYLNYKKWYKNRHKKKK